MYVHFFQAQQYNNTKVSPGRGVADQKINLYPTTLSSYNGKNGSESIVPNSNDKSKVPRNFKFEDSYKESKSLLTQNFNNNQIQNSVPTIPPKNYGGARVNKFSGIVVYRHGIPVAAEEKQRYRPHRAGIAHIYRIIKFSLKSLLLKQFNHEYTCPRAFMIYQIEVK